MGVYSKYPFLPRGRGKVNTLPDAWCHIKTKRGRCTRCVQKVRGKVLQLLHVSAVRELHDTQLTSVLCSDVRIKPQDKEEFIVNLYNGYPTMTNILRGVTLFPCLVIMYRLF